MFAKGYTNIRAMIETQYGILSQMITDIANRFQEDLNGTEVETMELAQNNSDGDYEVYYSILNSFTDIEERQSCLLRESRKILFCAMYSYYETMLNEIVRYYKIKCKTERPKQILDCILKEYKVRYGIEISGIEDSIKIVNDYYRLLRNLYMHGSLSKDKDMCNLSNFAGVIYGLKLFGIDYVNIEDNIFLIKALDVFKSILVCIETSFTAQMSDEQRMLIKAKEYVKEAINDYPPDIPGLENENPPYCSIKVHKLLCEAENLLLTIAKRENAEAQMLLADLYLSVFETPNKDKGLFWLKKSAAMKFLPAIEMLKRFK